MLVFGLFPQPVDHELPLLWSSSRFGIMIVPAVPIGKLKIDGTGFHCLVLQIAYPVAPK